jgi:cholesterol oxidase
MNALTQLPSNHYDVLVIGSGFGGSVTALRLTEKGYRVGVLEAGRRWSDADFAKTSWDIKRFLWAPKLGLKGIQRIHLLPDVLVLAGAGVGGGSLNYANVLYQPTSDAFYNDRQWGHITDWRDELAPFYDQAKRVLGAMRNPTTTPSDDIVHKVAAEMGVEHTYEPTPVGVFFGRDGGEEPGVEVDDPFFGGAGPRRTGCIGCGECMTGCRHNAKNTLVKNYLYLAEKAGAVVHAETTVTAVRPLPDGTYQVDTVRTGAWRPRADKRTFTADDVVMAAGAWGTQQLLHRMKATGVLPLLSDRLGVLSRTNSEALGGATTKWRHRKTYNFSQGVAITSAFRPNDHTVIEPIRYGKGSNLMGLIQTLAAKGGGNYPRWLLWLATAITHPGRVLSYYGGINRWSECTILAVVMQSLDNSLTLYPKRGLFGRWKITSKQGEGEPNPTRIPAMDDALERVAKHIDGFPINSVGEIFDIPMTAHFLGGCAIGDSATTGVIDAYHRVYGHPGLHIVDGSTIAANLGVNPSLTIAAQAERAMSFWPNKGEQDPRPPLDAAYQRLRPVPPHRPAVPATAFGALRV